jgi:plasmid stabilization system protein ParE
MRVRWTTNAAEDLASIVRRIREDNPEAASRVARTIYAAVGSLRTSPNRGRTVWLKTPGNLFSPLGRTLPYMKSSETKCRFFAFGMLRNSGRNYCPRAPFCRETRSNRRPASSSPTHCRTMRPPSPGCRQSPLSDPNRQSSCWSSASCPWKPLGR